MLDMEQRSHKDFQHNNLLKKYWSCQNADDKETSNERNIDMKIKLIGI